MDLTPFLRRIVSLGLAALLLIALLPMSADACPNCKVSVQGQDTASTAAGTSGSMSAGYAYSIYLMLTVPAILATGLILFIRREARQVRPSLGEFDSSGPTAG